METAARPRWRAQLKGWRGWLFAVLGLYVLGAAVFLLAGGGRPAMTSLVAMEAEVEAGDTDASQSPAATASEGS